MCKLSPPVVYDLTNTRGGGEEDRGGRMRRRPDRRRLLLLIGIFLLALFPSAAPPAVASPRVSGHIVANEVTFTNPTASGTLTRAGGAAILAVDAGSTGGGTLLYTSSPIDAGQLFDPVRGHSGAAPRPPGRVFVGLPAPARAPDLG